MKTTLLITLLLVAAVTQAQNKTPWHAKQCAVALTYDDALDVDLDNAIPALDSLGLKATFYLSGYSGALHKRLNEWRAIAKEGHELGNHTLFHPCIGNMPGREFVTPDYNLGTYTFRRIQDEIRMTNTVLKAIDGKTERTFAYPCGDTKIGDSFYLAPLEPEFVAARGTEARMHPMGRVNFYDIGCYAVNGQPGDALIALVKKAMVSNSLVVFLFHGVGGGHSLNVSLAAHSQLLHFLKQHEKEIWVTPLLDVAQYMKANNRNAN